MKNKTVSNIVKVATFSSLSFIFFYIGFPFPFLPSFLEIQFSNLPAIIAGFAMGPVSGLLVVLIRTVLKFLLMGTHTGGVGELADFLIGISVILTTSLIYKKHKNKKGGIIALVIGAIVWVVVSFMLNWLVLAPLYGLEDVATYLFTGALPFNVILAILVCSLTFVVYKSISRLLNKF